MSSEFEGVRALVTGGGSGIGADTVRLMTEQGARVASVDLADHAVPDGAFALVGDVSRPDIADVVAQAAERLGGLDVVVNNAGIGAAGSVEETDDDTFRRLFEVNVLGPARITRAALPHLRESDSAAVVNTCSVAAQIGLPARTAYSASKGALHALTLAMAADHMADGIRVCGVSPGTADTPWVRRLMAGAEDPDAELAALEARQPTGRLVGSEEVARTICMLASPRSASATGTVLVLDGGLTGLRLPPR